MNAHSNSAITTTLSWLDYAWLLVCVGIFAYLCVAFWGESYDDVFLAYQYAKNIEAGNGFVFNLHEHFLGTPAPLFVALLVGLHTLLPGITIPETGTIISAAGLSITDYSLYTLARQHNERLLGMLVSLLAVCNPFSLLVLGGESPLYLALVTTALVAVSANRTALAGAFLGNRGKTPHSRCFARIDADFGHEDEGIGACVSGIPSGAPSKGQGRYTTPSAATRTLLLR